VFGYRRDKKVVSVFVVLIATVNNNIKLKVRTHEKTITLVAIASLFIGCEFNKRDKFKAKQKEQIAIASNSGKIAKIFVKKAISQKRRYTCYP
jgi:hypothetical protein